MTAMAIGKVDAMSEVANMTACDVSGCDSASDMMPAHASKVSSVDGSGIRCAEPSQMSAAECSLMSPAECSHVGTAGSAYMAPAAACLGIGCKQAARSRGSGQDDHHPA
jgi:hypothetical protein